MASRNYFINGTTELLLLSLLENKDRYVYEIVKSINEFSGGFLDISQNTIYAVTYKLGNEGYISEYSVRVGKRRTRVYYHLEPKGAELLQQVREHYNRTTIGIQNIFDTLKAEAKEISEANKEKEIDDIE
ncbi:MAG: PadR family transcriptional regulator [Ruminococcus sp.]